MSKWPAWLHEMAVNGVCPINREPITPFEVNMVKTLEEFGQQVLNKYAMTASEGLSVQSESERPEWLIWSNEHRAWWGHKRCGYPEKIENAGRYTLTEARQLCRSRHWADGKTPPETMIHIDEVAHANPSRS